MSNNPYPHRDSWNAGEQAQFAYSLGFDKTSEICARLFHRTGEVVTVVRLNDPEQNEQWLADMPTLQERADEGAVVTYTVQFPDGHEDTAFEDELLELDYKEN